MNKVNLKILSDIDCNVYVDNELLANVKQNEVAIIPLCIGEYWLQCVCPQNPMYKIEQIVFVEYHKILRLDFASLIDSNPDYAIDDDFVYRKETRSYINKLTGREITPRIYDEGLGFHQGRAKVKRDGLWGYIDYSGKEVVSCVYYDLEKFIVIPTIYDDACDFQEGLAVVKHNGKYGCVDKDGNEVIPAIYDMIRCFNEGLACVKVNGKWGFVQPYK